MLDLKEIKQEIRRFRKLKLQCRPGSAERIDLEHKIKDLKRQLIDLNKPEPAKDSIITEILKIEAEQKTIPKFADIGIDLHKYTLEQLSIHLKKIKRT